LTAGPIGRANVHQCATFRFDCVNRCGDMTVSRFSKRRPSAILNFEKYEILTAYPGRRAYMRYRAKFRADRVEPLWRHGRFSIFQDGGVRHLGFLKVANFNWWTCSEGKCASTCQISCRSLGPLRRYGRFWYFASLPWKCLFMPFLGGFLGIWPPWWDTVSTNLTKVESTGHSGSAGIYSSFWETVWTKSCDEEEEEEVEEWEREFLGVIDVFKSNPDMTICDFLMSMCSFCGG